MGRSGRLYQLAVSLSSLFYLSLGASLSVSLLRHPTGSDGSPRQRQQTPHGSSLSSPNLAGGEVAGSLQRNSPPLLLPQRLSSSPLRWGAAFSVVVMCGLLSATSHHDGGGSRIDVLATGWLDPRQRWWHVFVFAIFFIFVIG